MNASRKHSRHEENREYLMRTGQLKDKKLTRNDGVWAVPDKEKRRAARPADVTLAPGDVPRLIEAAFANGGPIQAGEAYEHALAITCDNLRFYAYHFLVAPGGRAVLLSDRTVCGYVASMDRYAKQLVAYATALGQPRVILDRSSFCCFLARLLMLEMPGALAWSDAGLDGQPTNEDDRLLYRDNYSLSFARYSEASRAGAVRHPFKRSLAQQTMDVGVKYAEDGRTYLDNLPDGMDRDLTALCMAYMLPL